MENVKKAVQTLKLHTEVHILAASLRDLRGWLEEYHTLDREYIIYGQDT